MLGTLPTGENVRSFPPGDRLWFVLALFATIGGHTTFNRALVHVTTRTVVVTFVAEPLAAALFAWVVLGKALARAVRHGGLIVLAGVDITARAEHAD